MPSSRLTILAGIMIIILVFGGCKNEIVLDPDQQSIKDNTYEIFMRAKVNDKAVIYENEFPYLREERDLEEYLDNRYVKAYSTDTLVALQVDSVQVTGDSALSYVRLEFVRADSTFNITDIALRFRKYDDVWIKPSLSLLADQLEFEEELRIYWEAVKEMEKGTEGDGEAEEDKQ